MLSFMLKIEPLVVLKPPYTNVARYIDAAGIVNIVARWTLTGVFIAVLIACAAYIYQIARLVLRRPDAPATVQVL